jgi:hypothetical protein
MSAVPKVRGNGQALYPLTRSREFSTDVAQFVNGTEQRFKVRAGLTRLKLPYSALVGSDATSLKEFVDSAKGMFDPNGTITLTDSFGSAISYADLALDQDTIEVTELEPLLYNTQIELHQVKNRNTPPPDTDPSFPVFDNGLTAQRPYKQIRRFLSAVVDQAAGIRYAWAWYGEGLDGFPDGALMAWELTLLLSDFNLSIIETYFRGKEGRMWPFSFTDPDDASVHPNCRFDQDVLDIQHAGVNNNQLKVQIVEFQVNS